MSFPVFCLFLILLQNRLTEQVTEKSTEPATDDTSFSSENPSTTTEQIYHSSVSTWSNEINLSTIETTIENSTPYATTIHTYTSTDTSTENSTSYTRNNQANSSTNQPTTEDSTTISTVTIKLQPTILSRALPDNVSTEPKDKISNEQESISYEKNFSTASVFGIVLGSIVSTIAVFYITVSLITKYRRKSYTVRSPSIELGQA